MWTFLNLQDLSTDGLYSKGGAGRLKMTSGWLEEADAINRDNKEHS